jgi:hypothetical protein
LGTHLLGHGPEAQRVVPSAHCARLVSQLAHGLASDGFTDGLTHPQVVEGRLGALESEAGDDQTRVGLDRETREPKISGVVDDVEHDGRNHTSITISTGPKQQPWHQHCSRPQRGMRPPVRQHEQTCRGGVSASDAAPDPLPPGILPYPALEHTPKHQLLPTRLPEGERKKLPRCYLLPCQGLDRGDCTEAQPEHPSGQEHTAKPPITVKWLTRGLHDHTPSTTPGLTTLTLGTSVSQAYLIRPTPTTPFTPAQDPDLGFPRSNMPPFNLTGLPTLALPCSVASSGLPLSLQLAGRPFEEGIVLRVGHAYEQATLWHESGG